MKKIGSSVARRGLLLTLFVLGVAGAVSILPTYFHSHAGGVKTGTGLFIRTESQREDLPNYDIRSDKDAVDRIAAFRSERGRMAAEVADVRDSFVRGEETLRSKVPTLKVEYNADIRTPEVIAPAVGLKRESLTGPSGADRSEILRGFLKQNTELVGTNDRQVDELKTTADYTNPDGNLSFVVLNQEINGIPVFRGEVKAGFSKTGEMFRVINNLAPGLEYSSLSADFGDPANAVTAAAGHIKHELRQADLSRNAAESSDIKVTFGQGDWATTAEKMYFPTEPGVAVPAWRVLIWQPVSAYYVVVDAQTGTMLWRKNIGEDQTQAATYQVYTNPNAMINSADNPSPLTPGPVTPVGPIQPPTIARTNVTRVGNEAPYTFNNNGWITDGINVTDGNAVEAGVDRVAPNGVDATQTGIPSRVFDSTWNPPPGNPAPGDDPLTAQAQRGAVISMFYIMNLYHDEMYRLGFTEQANNFQNDNFGRGGAAADRVSAEGQDSSGTNNANFNTAADGARGRMQMYIWTGPTPDYDGTTDADIIIHEVTHGTSNRLHGNAAGLTNNMSRGMGEGWGDFYGHAMLSEPTDPINGVYTTGGYATYLGASGYTSNFYYGIRRFPKAIMSSTGGPNNRPHNPLTFADLNAGCVLTDGAFPRGPFGVAQCDAVHNAGEIWSSMLWEVRAKYIARLGWAVGNRRVLQHVTDGMKLAPIGPTFIQERDAIIAGALAGGTPADVADLWAGFAVRGMGFSSRVTAIGSPAVVVEGFDLPNLLQTPDFAVSDAAGNNNGFPEPGETLALTIPLSNSTGNAATGTTLQVVGGGTANYGTIANGATVTQTASFTVPAGATCGAPLTLTFNVNSSLGATSFTRTIIIGVPVTTTSQNFDGVTAPSFPAGWTNIATGGGLNFVTATFNPFSGPNSAFAADPTSVGGGTELTSPSVAISAQAATISFRNRFVTEAGWDGGALEISVNGGIFTDIITAGGRFVTGGYNSTLGAGTNNPLANRPAWSGDSNGYMLTTVQLPATAAGQNVQFKFRFGGDDNTAGGGANPGWYIDDVQVVGSYTCGGVVVPTVKSRADFDGDGKTDVSVFRPSEGNWYLNQSTAGFGVLNWGVSSDVLIPGDYDGDGKADAAIFRATADPSQPDFYILKSNGFTVTGVSWGIAGDVPLNGDYDGDSRTDIAIYRASTNTFYILNSSNGANTVATFGSAGDVPFVIDNDGDGKDNIAAYRPSTNTWFIARPTGNPSTNFDQVVFGSAGDKLVPADYDGDNKGDIAVFRPSNGTWFILKSSGGTQITPWGSNGDVPAPGDYDGDGKDDLAVYRGGVWYLNRSTAGVAIFSFGVSTDQPIPAKYLP